MSDLEICKIRVENGNNDFIKTLLLKSMFKVKQNLFKILEFCSYKYPQKSEPYEYLSTVPHINMHDMG